MDKSILKDVIVEQNKLHLSREGEVLRDLLPSIKSCIHIPHVVVIAGMRRVGKSTLLAQIRQKYYPDRGYYLSFEDERLLHFTVDDFNHLYELFVELYGEQNVFFLDEIQNIPRWELFVRRMQDRGFKFFITGSNSSLLSKELSTKLTGRAKIFELYPFSFQEFLRFEKFHLEKNVLSQTKKRGLLKNKFSTYLKKGGMPEYLKYQDISLSKIIYEDILYRDILVRYEIKEIKALRELSLYLLSHIACRISYSNLKNMLNLGSVNTVKNYIHYLENSFLIFTISPFSYSLKQQNLSHKKVYAIDNGLTESIAFQFSKNTGHYLENLVFLELKRRGYEIFYYKTKNNLEVDFLIREGRAIKMLIQVTEHIDTDKIRNRELKALTTAMMETSAKEALLLTLDQSLDLDIDGNMITVRPIYPWLLDR